MSQPLPDRLRSAALDLEQHATGLNTYRYTDIIAAVREAAETLDARSEVPFRTLENVALFARRGLSFGNQATPQTPEHVAGQRAVMLRAILRKCEEAGVTSSPLRESPSPLTEAKP